MEILEDADAARTHITDLTPEAASVSPGAVETLRLSGVDKDLNAIDRYEVIKRPDPPQTPGSYELSRAARTNWSKTSARYRSLPVLHVHNCRVRPKPAATVLPCSEKARPPLWQSGL